MSGGTGERHETGAYAQTDIASDFRTSCELQMTDENSGIENVDAAKGESVDQYNDAI